jgi:hypothetical protein
MGGAIRSVGASLKGASFLGLVMFVASVERTSSIRVLRARVGVRTYQMDIS